MNQRIRAIVEQARKLSREERLELFDQLEAEFLGDEGDGTPEEIEAAWMEEVARRVEAAERGETTFVDFDVAMEKARRLIRQP